MKLRSIIAISGSTRKNSTNNKLILAIKELCKTTMHIELYGGISNLPHFNPDLDSQHPPETVLQLRQLIKNAEGVLICTPEYAMGVPGSLKNAIDWLVSSAEFSHKPVALITASSMGQNAHASFLSTLKIIEADITDDTQLLISFAATKINGEGEITDPETVKLITELTTALYNKIIISENSNQPT